MIRATTFLLFMTLCRGFSVHDRAAGPSTIESDLKTVDQDTNTFTYYLQHYNSINPGGNPEGQLEQALKTCGTDAQGTTTRLTLAQAQTICNYINVTLYNDTKTLLDTLTAKKSTFAANGLQSAALTDLKALKNETDVCLGNVGALCPSPAKSTCTSASKGYDRLYASVISVYSK